jgi:hypothetical protein
MNRRNREIAQPDAGAGERGQALVVFAVALFVLAGMMALAIEVGWSRYVQKEAQSAADAAALAAAVEAFRAGDFANPNSGVATQSAAECPAFGNLDAACDYAEANGFVSGGDYGRQSVQVAAGLDSAAPGVPDVPVDYWVQVTARHNLPQLFSGVISHIGLSPTAKATAAVRMAAAEASMYLLNRKDDCFVSVIGLGLVCGEDLLTIGGNYIGAPMGIYMASSNGAGLGLPNISAGTVLGALEVDAPFTYLMGDGAINPLLGLGAIDWDAAPTNGFPDGEMFVDPMAGKDQPPAPSGLVDRPVSGGVIIGGLFAATAKNLPPGSYYATEPLGLLGNQPTGLPVTIIGHVRFSDGDSNPCGGFCEYVFYGGVVTAALSNVTFSPGRYVFAGAQPIAGGPGVGLTVGVNATIKDRTPLVSGKIGAPNDAGEIFIFTDANYPGLSLPVDLASSGLSFPQVRAGLLAGLGAEITLHGLNESSSALPAELLDYTPVLMWQDRANTTLKYDADGFLDRTCGGICDQILEVPGSQEMIIQATQRFGRAGTQLWGTVYGPRGSWLTILGVFPGDTVAGPLQVITGALQMTLNADLDLEDLPSTVTRVSVGLIQ